MKLHEVMGYLYFFSHHHPLSLLKQRQEVDSILYQIVTWAWMQCRFQETNEAVGATFLASSKLCVWISSSVLQYPCQVGP